MGGGGLVYGAITRSFDFASENVAGRSPRSSPSTSAGVRVFAVNSILDAWKTSTADDGRVPHKSNCGPHRARVNQFTFGKTQTSNMPSRKSAAGKIRKVPP